MNQLCSFLKATLIILQLAIFCAMTIIANSKLNAAESGGGFLLVANKGDQTLSIVDPVAGAVITNVAENGVTGHEVVASADGRRAFVPIYGNAGVGRAGTDGSLIRVLLIL